jgi:hypothetical protein
MRKPRQKKIPTDPQIMCGLCKQTEMMWLSCEAPPKVVFDTLSCLLTNLVAQSVDHTQRQTALDYITETSKSMLTAYEARAKGQLN